MFLFQIRANDRCLYMCTFAVPNLAFVFVFFPGHFRATFDPTKSLMPGMSSLVDRSPDSGEVCNDLDLGDPKISDEVHVHVCKMFQNDTVYVCGF